MVFRSHRFRYITLAFAFLVLITNYLLYTPFIQSTFTGPLVAPVVWGSLFDLAIVIPLLLFATFQMGWKHVAIASFIGILGARFLVPEEFQATLTPILLVGLAIEAIIVLGELVLIGWLIWKIPKIRHRMRSSQIAPLYTALPSVAKETKHHFILRLLTMEWLVFYYGLLSYKTKTPNHAGTFTLHMKSSAIALHIMLIHALVIETIGIHWFLHSMYPVVSWVLLVFNVYGLIYILADIQITRLAPLEIKDDHLSVAQGLSKHLYVPLSTISKVRAFSDEDEPDEMIVYKDFEARLPNLYLQFREPVLVNLAFGRTKQITSLAIAADEPQALLTYLNQHKSLKSL